MICYKDKTFCVSPSCTNKCGRKLTPEIKEAAQKWWGMEGEAPIAISCFCGGELKDYSVAENGVEDE
jgi:hypothetical protein